MSKKCKVKLVRAWFSSYCTRVELALKARNKSYLLLKQNPVHKKVPVMLHKGNSISESLIILEYIDCWKDGPTLLPCDPYRRAQVRFWANYFSWIDGLRECPLMKETLPPHDKLVAKITEKFNFPTES
ncbi:hypothetical protein ABFS83_12G102800 [Erythranthe nasuta]